MFKECISLLEQIQKQNYTKSYCFDTFGFRVYSDSFDLLEMVDEYLSPHLSEMTAEPKENWDVYYIYGEFNLKKKREQKIIGTYGADSLVTASGYEDDTISFYHNDESNNKTLIDYSSNKAFVIYHKKSFDLNLLEDCYALIRNICYSYLRKKGAILYHGCAFQYQGKNYILLGEKGAGKTTLQHFAMAQLNCNYISADRTIVWQETDKVLCAGWMSTYRPNIDILKLLPEDSKKQKLNAYYEKMKNKPCYFQKNKIRISPKALINILDIDSISIGQLHGIIFMEKPEDKKYSLEKINFKTAQQLSEKYFIDLESQGVSLSLLSQNKNNHGEMASNRIQYFYLTGRGDIQEIQTVFKELICE